MMKIAYPLLTALALMMCTGNAYAHNVNVFGFIQGDELIVEGYFGGKAKAVHCVVELYNSQNAKIGSGTTDENGIARFNIHDLAPESQYYKIILEAGMGHKSEFVLRMQNDIIPTNKQSPGIIGEKSLSTTDLNTLLDAKLEPLLNILGNQQRLLLELSKKNVSISEIIGGFGWIFGLLGCWAYFKSRKHINSKLKD